MSYLKCLLILLIGFSTITLYAQEENFLRGRVYETTSNIPIVYATVRIKGKAKGVITNMDGGFRLPKNLYQLGDTIQVSSMGYQLTNFPISKLSPSEINILRLPTSLFSLDEAVVSAKRKKRLTARQIVKKAIERIPINYLTSGFSQKGYYRDYQLNSEGYLNLNEAILEVYDPGFDYNDSNYSEVSIYESRLNEAFKRNDRAAKAYDYLNYEKIIDKAFLPSYGGNEFLILRVHDAIRNFRVNSFDYVNVLNDGDLVANHSFRKFHETSLGDEKLYKIGLIRRMEDFRALGTIYISKNDFAIHKLEYAVFDRTFEGERSVEEYQKEGKFIFEVITEYKRGRNNKMELNFISFHNNFTLAAPSKFIIEEVVFRPDRKAIEIKFNNNLNPEVKTHKKSSYSLKYLGVRLKIDYLMVLKKSVLVFLQVKDEEWNKMMDSLNGGQITNGNVNGENFQFDVGGILDEFGNVINEGKLEEYNQFREFFVQETQMGFTIPSQELLMKKDKPFFDKEQPIVLFPDIGGYWMNTPLKPLEENSLKK